MIFVQNSVQNFGGFTAEITEVLYGILNPLAQAFNEHCLTASCPFVRIDVLGLTAREEDRGVSKAPSLPRPFVTTVGGRSGTQCPSPPESASSKKHKNI